MKRTLLLFAVISFLSTYTQVLGQEDSLKTEFINSLFAQKKELVKSFKNLETTPKKGKARAKWEESSLEYRYKFKAKKSGRVNEVFEVRRNIHKNILPILYMRFYNGELAVAERYNYDEIYNFKPVSKEVLLYDTYRRIEY